MNNFTNNEKNLIDQQLTVNQKEDPVLKAFNCRVILALESLERGDIDGAKALLTILIKDAPSPDKQNFYAARFDRGI